ncbi:MAG: hypothetical protein R3330_04175, partial [Saprospiraceae bacterium]|nr:hypothetical protein [Saprospiraceae bacterium]
DGEGDLQIAKSLTVLGSSTMIGVINAHFGMVVQGNSFFTDLVSMNNNRIVALEDPINDKDAVNKQYLEAYVADQSPLFPRNLSNESAVTMSFLVCANYCYTLVEDGFEDWGIPSAEQLSYFTGQTNDASTLWTSTPAVGRSSWAYGFDTDLPAGDPAFVSGPATDVLNHKVLIRLHTGQNETASYEDPNHKCRCVR